MNIGIYTNIYKDSCFSFTKRVASSLKESGAGVFFCGEVAKEFSAPDAFLDKSVKLDFVVVLGGDGTILRVVPFCIERRTPILGINLGTVGFLTGFEKEEDLSKLYAMLKNKKYKIENRNLLEVSFCKKDAKDNKTASVFAINEAVVSRKAVSKMALLRVYANHEFIGKYSCDGFIVSSPLGSTAYSLSAGGPIVSPNAAVLTLTPIAAHSLKARPLILEGTSSVKIIAEKSDCVLYCDGQEIAEICSEVAVKTSKKEASFIKQSDESFFSRLDKKLSNWS